ncbi:MAG: hypothetical protein HW391_1525 [Chloroflexi bacterium]|nr:hypothetical protein [Chloroflexota bacterium]
MSGPCHAHDRAARRARATPRCGCARSQRQSQPALAGSRARTGRDRRTATRSAHRSRTDAAGHPARMAGRGSRSCRHRVRSGRRAAASSWSCRPRSGPGSHTRRRSARTDPARPGRFGTRSACGAHGSRGPVRRSSPVHSSRPRSLEALPAQRKPHRPLCTSAEYFGPSMPARCIVGGHGFRPGLSRPAGPPGPRVPRPPSRPGTRSPRASP